MKIFFIIHLWVNIILSMSLYSMEQESQVPHEAHEQYIYERAQQLRFNSQALSLNVSHDDAKRVIAHIGMNDAMALVIPDYIDIKPTKIRIPERSYYDMKYFALYSECKKDIYICSYSDEEKEWNVQPLTIQRAGEQQLLWSGTGQFLAVLGEGNDESNRIIIYVYDKEKKAWKINKSLIRFDSPFFNSFVWNPSNNSFALFNDTKKKVYVYSMSEKGDWTKERLTVKSDVKIKDVQWSADGKFLGVNVTNSLSIYCRQVCDGGEPKKGEWVWVKMAPYTAVDMFKWHGNPNNYSFLIKLSDGKIVICSYDEGQQTWHPLPLPLEKGQEIYGILWSYDGNHVALKAAERVCVYSYDTKKNKWICTLKSDKCFDLYKLGISDDSKFLTYTEGLDHVPVICVWNHNQWVRTPFKFLSPRACVTFNGDGKCSVNDISNVYLGSYEERNNTWKVIHLESTEEYASCWAKKAFVANRSVVSPSCPWLYNYQSNQWLCTQLCMRNQQDKCLEFIWDPLARYILGATHDGGLYSWNRELCNNLSMPQIKMLLHCVRHKQKVKKKSYSVQVPAKLQAVYHSLPDVVKKKLILEIKND